MSDTILEHDDLSATQEYAIAGGVILLFGLLYWFFNYGMPNFGAYSAAVPAPLVLDDTARPERFALNDAPASAADASAETSAATQQAPITDETTANQQQQMRAVSDGAQNTDAKASADEQQPDEQSQVVVSDSAATVDQSLTEVKDKTADAAVDTGQQAVALTDDAATDNSQQAEKVTDAATDDVQQQAQTVTAEQGGETAAPAAQFVIMDVAVAKLRDHLVNGEMEKPVVMESINFVSGSSTIELKSDHQIKAIAGLLQQHPGTQLLIRGHTDSAGPDVENKELSLMRARAMGEKLVEAGVASENIIIMGMGSAEPLSGNNTQQGRGKDRRIDVSITQ